MNKKLGIVILNCLIIFLAGTIYAFGQENGLNLKDKRITIKMDKQPLGKVFEHLIVNYDVPIGFEESVLDRNHNDYEFETNLPYQNKKNVISADGSIQISITTEREFIVKQNWFSIDVENGSLKDVLNIIVGQMKNYKWEINDGVVNIFPSLGRDEKFEKLLELKINNFNLELADRPLPNGKPIFLIRTKIFELPEITKFLEENNLRFGRYRESVDNLRRKLKNEVNFSNLTFRQLLNKTTKIKRGGWILKENDLYGSKEKEYIEINI